MELSRILIIDFPSGIYLYEKVVQWEGESPSSGVSNLIISIFQMGQSLGKGNPTSISFEENAVENRSNDLKKGNRAMKCSLGTLEYHDGRLLIVCVFHSPQLAVDKASTIANQIAFQFEKSFGSNLLSVMNNLDDLVDEKKKSGSLITEADIRQTFSSFNPVY